MTARASAPPLVGPRVIAEHPRMLFWPRGTRQLEFDASNECRMLSLCRGGPDGAASRLD